MLTQFFFVNILIGFGFIPYGFQPLLIILCTMAYGAVILQFILQATCVDLVDDHRDYQERKLYSLTFLLVGLVSVCSFPFWYAVSFI